MGSDVGFIDSREDVSISCFKSKLPQKENVCADFPTDRVDMHVER